MGLILGWKKVEVYNIRYIGWLMFVKLITILCIVQLIVVWKWVMPHENKIIYWLFHWFNYNDNVLVICVFVQIEIWHKYPH